MMANMTVNVSQRIMEEKKKLDSLAAAGAGSDSEDEK